MCPIVNITLNNYLKIWSGLVQETYLNTMKTMIVMTSAAIDTAHPILLRISRAKSNLSCSCWPDISFYDVKKKLIIVVIISNTNTISVIYTQNVTMIYYTLHRFSTPYHGIMPCTVRSRKKKKTKPENTRQL